MTTEQAIKILHPDTIVSDARKAMWEVGHDPCDEVEMWKARDKATLIACDALQEKLARESGCGHCQSSKVIYPKFGGDQFYIEMCGNEITLWDDCVCVAGFGVRYCPMCGKGVKHE